MGITWQVHKICQYDPHYVFTAGIAVFVLGFTNTVFALFLQSAVVSRPVLVMRGGRSLA